MARDGSARRGMLARPAQHAQRQRRPRSQGFAIRLPRRASTTSLQRIGDFKPRKLKADWQRDAFTYYEALPAVGYVLDHKASTAASCMIRLVEEDPKKGEVPSSDDKADAVLRSLVGPRGGIEEVVRRAVLLLEISGEAYLVGTPVEDQTDAIFWEFLSVEEILPPEQPGQAYRRNATGGDKEDMAVDAYIARMWRSDARHSSRSHTGLRRCLDTCRELMLLGQMTEAIISSRLPMGLLLIPDDMTWHSPLNRVDPTAGGGSDDEASEEPDFMDDLLAHMAAPIRDFGSAASMVPLVVQASRDDLAQVRVVELAKDLDRYASGLRDEMHGRLALGLDVPPEIVSGKAGLNHWSSWNVDNEFLDKHVAPVGRIVADFLTYAFLRPMLELSGVPAEEAARFTLRFDTSPLRTKADDDQKAIVLWQAGLISDVAVIEKQGWDSDSVMPDDKERQRRLVEKLLLEGVLKLSEDGLKLLKLDPKWFDMSTPAPIFGGPPGPGGEAPEPDMGDEDGPPTPRGRRRRAQPGDGAVDPDAPDSTSGQDEPPRPRGGRNGQASAADVDALILAERITARADAARDRALERAGNRVANCARRVPAFSGQFAGRRAGDVLSHVDDAGLRALRVTVDDLLDGAWTELDGMVRGWVREYLHARGVPPGDVDSAAVLCARRVCAGLHAFTVENLHRQVPVGGHGHRVPMDVVTVPLAEALAGVVVAA